MKSLARTSRGGPVDAARTFFDDGEMIDIMSLFGTLWRRKWLILLLACLGSIAGWGYGKQKVPLYTAEASVVVEPREERVLNIEKVIGGLMVDEAAIATEVDLIRSRGNLLRVMEDLRLFDDPEFNPALKEEEPLLSLDLNLLLEKAKTLLPNEWLVATGLAGESKPEEEVDPKVLAASPIMREIAAGSFGSRLNVWNDGLSYVIHINFTSEDREKAAEIANRLAEVYVESQIKTKLYATDRASSFLEERLAAMREEVQKAEAAVAQYRAENGLLDTGGVILSETELSNLNKDLITARGELAERQARLRLVRELKKSGLGLDATSDVLNNGLIMSLRNQEADLLRKEAELRAQYGPRHPLMVQLREDKASLEGKVQAEIDRIAAGLENDVRVTQARISTIEASLTAIKNSNIKDRTAEVKLAELERQAQSTRDLYQQFLHRFKETREQQELVEPDARIITLAAPPVAPSTLGKNIYVAAGFTASFVIGSALALLLDRLDKGIRSAREIERLTGLPTLGMIPRVERLKRNQKPHNYLMEKPLSAYAEAIRSVYMSIKLGKVDQPSKLVLVTSSLPEEGKTTLAVSLAIFAARSHKRVLLIDLDLRHPSVHRELGWQIPAGLVEYMMGDRTLDEVIQHDIETGLDFLPVKAQTTNPTDLIDSQKMRDFLRLCRERYDLVIIDSAPIASVTDARALATMVDRVVYVVQWGVTVGSVVQDSIKVLQELDAEVSGVALTRVDLAKHAQYGYGDVTQYYTRSKKYYVN